MPVSDLETPEPGSPAPAAAAYDGAGGLVQLSELWRDGPVVLVFLRHWG